MSARAAIPTISIPLCVTPVFAVSHDRRGVVRYRHVLTRRGGWHWYENADTRVRFVTRNWFPFTTPQDALAFSALADIGLARDCVIDRRRTELLNFATNALRCLKDRQWRRVWGHGGTLP